MIARIVNKSVRSMAFKPANGFCVFQAYLNPERHILMSHNINNVYEDIFGIGEYPIPRSYAYKLFSQQYVPTIINTTYEVLNSKYNLQLNTKNWEEQDQFVEWQYLGVKDIDAQKSEILTELSRKIFVRESKFRYPIEQRQRLEESMYVYSRLPLKKTKPYQFVDTYNTLIWIGIERSNLWQSPNVKGDASFLEKHAADHSEQPIGVPDLSSSNPNNSNFINSFLAKIHKV